MKDTDAINLIRSGVAEKSGAVHWADLGSGSGTFTNALSNLLGKGSKIIAIDKEVQRIQSSNAEVAIEFIKHDFEKKLPELPPLDGILLANALHYVKDQIFFIKQLSKLLKADGRLILVEYDTDKSNAWVPFPVTFIKMKQLLAQVGYTSVLKIGEMDSVYNQNKLYACLALRKSK
jgi:ubiquinone/menaquinone biosynthesis C-methylase UbiE